MDNLKSELGLFKTKPKIVKMVSNGHSPQIRENGKLLVRMGRGESHFSQKWRLANVGESGEYSVNGLANVGEFGNPRNTARQMLASLASPRNTAWRMSASLASPRNTARRKQA